jgi:GNAT superfamily N-acetyltransferase
MEFIRIESVDSDIFKSIWEIYEEALQKDERRDMENHEKIFSDKRYHMIAVTLDNEVTGLIGYWDFRDFVFLEHIAVGREFRGKGMGSEIIDKFLEQHAKVILETDRPEDGEMAARRLEFYKRCGLKQNPFDYVQPSYGKGKKPVPMILMSYPDELDEDAYASSRNLIHKEVYGLKEPLKQMPRQ